MKKQLLLLTFIFVFLSCQKNDLQEQTNQRELTDKEMEALIGLSIGDQIAEHEIIAEAESYIDFLAKTEPKTRSGSRSIKSIEAIRNKLNVSTRTSGHERLDTAIYIINFENNDGFIMLSADRRTNSILAMAPEGNLDITEENMPDIPVGLMVFLTNTMAIMDEQIAETNQLRIGVVGPDPINPNKPLWPPVDIEIVIHDSIVYGEWEVVHEVKPLVKVLWGQREPYNNKAPLIKGQRALAGCVATAIAMVMSAHCFPELFNWDLMNKHCAIDSEYEERDHIPAYNAIATLFRLIGDNVDMDWGLDGSGAATKDSRIHFQKMGYRNSGSFMDYNHYKIENSLFQGNPVIIAAYSHRADAPWWWFGFEDYEYSGGHAWVIDGLLERRRDIRRYKNGEIFEIRETEQHLVHCNYGHNGGGDGYYNSGNFHQSKNDVDVSTRSIEGEDSNYRFNMEIITNISPY